MTYTREQVVACARAMYGDGDLAEVLAAVDRYGAESHERDVQRVQLAILQLSAGRKEELLHLVECAKSDYRDVLAWQELGPLSPQEGAKWQAMAKGLIDGWGKQ